MQNGSVREYLSEITCAAQHTMRTCCTSQIEVIRTHGRQFRKGQAEKDGRRDAAGLIVAQIWQPTRRQDRWIVEHKADEVSDHRDADLQAQVALLVMPDGAAA
jgi:hypothetical protein